MAWDVLTLSQYWVTEMACRMDTTANNAEAGLDKDAWLDLTSELDEWARQGLTASFWWRDDDAITTGPQLTHLLELSGKYQAPVGLAVVPAKADDRLASAVYDHNHAYVLQHGYAHINHAAGTDVKGAWELGLQRPLDTVLAELEAGRVLLDRLIDGDRFVPVVVPPWNRIDPAVIGHLAGLGFVGLSTCDARPGRDAAPGLRLVNVHCDPIKWKGGARFTGTRKAISFLTDHLSAKRTGLADPEEPTGYITHHAVHDDAIWAFSETLIGLLHASPAARFVSPKEAFSQ